MDPRLIRLRVELFTALQMLQGEDLEEFVRLVRELYACLPVRDPDRVCIVRSPDVGGGTP